MFFYKFFFVDIFSLTHVEEEAGHVGPTPYYSKRQVVSACQNFRPVAPFFFLVKLPFLTFFEYRKGVAI